MRSLQPPGSPVHLVLGDSGAGCMRAACECFCVPGKVIGFEEDPTHGPLISGPQSRKWNRLVDRLRVERPDSVIVWTGDNVSDTIFLTMVCDRLATLPTRLERVSVPGIDACPYLAMHSPEQIALLYATRIPLSAEDLEKQALEFVRICDSCGPIRRLENGKVISMPANSYDGLLLSACNSEWRTAAFVVGAAMGNCDAPNLMSDDFFSARLGHLIENRSIESHGNPAALRNCRVRLAPC